MPRPPRREVLHVMIPRDLKGWLAREARRERRSVANYLAGLLDTVRRQQQPGGASGSPTAAPSLSPMEQTHDDHA
jgi:hypothetical protein